MYDVENLFVQYSRRRKRGLTAKEIVQELAPSIKGLSNQQRELLKQRIRTWEAEYMPVPANMPEPPTPNTVDEPSVRRITIESADEEQNETIVDVICLFCGRLNRVGEEMCYACGRILEQNATIDCSTRLLRQTTDLFYSDEFFGEDFVLSLKVRGANDVDRNNTYEIRPQKVGEITIGRKNKNSEEVPTIDLTDHSAEERGVSRRHLSLHYDHNDKVLRAVDRGSANGTYVNGQHLHRNEIRVLRNGDELRLGKLVMSVKFYTFEFGS